MLLYKAKLGQNQLKMTILGPKSIQFKPKIGQNLYLGGFKALGGGDWVILEILYMLYTIRKPQSSSFQNAQNFCHRIARSKVMTITVKDLSTTGTQIPYAFI